VKQKLNPLYASVHPEVQKLAAQAQREQRLKARAQWWNANNQLPQATGLKPLPQSPNK
jgi:hypothetical protein